jgi:hypothetical protein
MVLASVSIGPAIRGAQPAVTFLANGEESDGWSWLRDAEGSQRAAWSFWGTPTGEPLTITFGLLATDSADDGTGVPAQLWLTIGSIESGAPGPVLLGPGPVIFPNVSPPDDPAGSATLGSVTIPPEELSPTMQGIWVLVERRCPDGSVIPVDLAVNRDAVKVTGLDLAGSCTGACPLASTSATPSVPPSPV